MASAAPPPQYASSLDEHVHGMVHSVLASHNEWATQSHLAWLQRMYTRVLLRTLELDRREMDLARREAAFARGPKKSRRGRTSMAKHLKLPDPEERVEVGEEWGEGLPPPPPSTLLPPPPSLAEEEQEEGCALPPSTREETPPAPTHAPTEPPEGGGRRKKGTARAVPSCGACGSVSRLKDLDPEVAKKARAAARGRGRSLGFLREPDRRR